MNILAVETSGEILSVALRAGGRDFSLRSRPRSTHDETILKVVDAALKRARIDFSDLNAIAVASGPGRFTGIRTGMAFAAVASQQLSIPAYAVSRLEALAFRFSETSVCCVIPGWREEKYYQMFRRSRPSAAPKPAGPPVWVTALEWEKERRAIESSGVPVREAEPDAADLLAPASLYLSRRARPRFAPLYLKPASYERTK